MTTQQEDQLVELWAAVLVQLVRRYPGSRMGMWTRLPNLMVAAARQTTRIARWQTDALKMAGIDDPGSRAEPNSLGGAVERLRTEVRGWFNDPADAERRALRAVCLETAAVVAAAREMWTKHKEASRADAEG